MLQQTRVETVIPYYERFLARFPDVAALASADLDDVLARGRASATTRARATCSAPRSRSSTRFAGRLPDGADALRELPGIGRYTAGAIASIAFDRPRRSSTATSRACWRGCSACASRSRAAP